MKCGGCLKWLSTMSVCIVLMQPGISLAQTPPLSPQEASRQAYLQYEPLRQRNARLQIETIDTVRWLGGFPNRYTGLRNAPSLAAIYSGATTGLVNGQYVFEPWPYVPGDIWGFQWDDLVAQPVGNRIRFNGPNRYTYEPVYSDPIVGLPGGLGMSSAALGSPALASPDTAVAAGPNLAEAFQVGRDPTIPAAPPLIARLPFDPASQIQPAPQLPPDQLLAFASRNFRQGNYRESLECISQIPVTAEKYPLAKLLESHAQFATGDFDGAAATLQFALESLPVQKWGLVLRSFGDYFPHVGQYTQQLRALEAEVTRNPRSPDGRFLLAYHYGYLGHRAEAIAELRQVLMLLPENVIAQTLLGIFAPQQKPEAPMEGRRSF